MSTLDTLLSLTEKFSGDQAITLHPERCLNRRFRMRNCSICADSCPAEGAITVTNGKPALDNEACLHCGLCLHRCPTSVFTRPDPLARRLVETVAHLPSGPIDLICPAHPSPTMGGAPVAVQTKRCLAALSPATLLQLAASGREIWLDDSPCAGCPLGQVQPMIAQSLAEANGWASFIDGAPSLTCRSQQPAPAVQMQRRLFQADQPSLSRREFFSSLKKLGQESAAVALQGQTTTPVASAGPVPVSQRLPYRLPDQRQSILAFLEQKAQTSEAESAISANNLPLAEVIIDPDRCSACGLCARFCPTGTIVFGHDDRQFGLAFQEKFCLGADCAICTLACPEGAISLQPLNPTSELLTKRPHDLVRGELARCQKCGQPAAKQTDEPVFCFACRSSQTPGDLFKALPD